MKKFLALLAACMLLVLTTSSAFATTVDLSYVESNTDVFEVDPSSDGTAKFIETVLTSEERHFTHKYESDYYWSSTQFDVLVLGLDGDDQYPVWRCWIVFADDQRFRNIDSATFVLNGVSYTFSDIGDPEIWHSTRENDDGTITYLEEMLIKFGMNNVEFPAALEEYRRSLPEDFSGFECTLILHAADEDITISLGQGFIWDFALTLEAYIQMAGLETIERVVSTEMTVK